MAYITKEETERSQWVSWLAEYGAEKFYAAFMHTAQDARSKCEYCGRTIQLDIREGGGVPDWHHLGDYGCDDSPETTEDGCGSHKAQGTTFFNVEDE